jgi:hypothetical protein
VDKMTLGEFKAWLEGFSEAFVSGSPNKKQYAKIQERLAEVQDTPISFPGTIIIRNRDYYRPWWPPIYETVKTGTTWTLSTGGLSAGNGSYNTTSMQMTMNENEANTFYCDTAREIGKLEAANL